MQMQMNAEGLEVEHMLSSCSHMLAGLVAVTANQTPLNYSLIVTNCMKLVAWAADNGDVNAWLLDVANDID